MDDKRLHHRINCASKCVLYHARKKYSAMILNISLAGASVKLFNVHPGVIRAGDFCNLVLSPDATLHLCKHKGKVVRTSSLDIGLEFIEIKSV